MRERGVVIEISNGRAVIEIEPAEGCGRTCSCAAVAGRPNLRRVELDAPEGLQPGAVVTLEVKSGQVLTSSAVLFLVPPACFVVGAAAGPALLGALGLRLSADLATMLVGAFGFILGLAGALAFSRRSGKSRWLKPRIVEVSGVSI